MPLKDLVARKAYLKGYYQRRKAADPDYNKKNWERFRSVPENYAKYLKQSKKAYHNPDTGRKLKQKNAFLKCTYGITLDDYNKMVEEQQGCCQICGRHQTEFVYALGVDHRHSDGKIRGLLCSRCNRDLSVLEDEKYCLKLMRYLEYYE